MDFQTSALILAWVAILVLALAMSGLMRHVQALSTGRVVQEQIGPPIGSKAPPLPLGDEGERSATTTTTVALFLDRSCEVCERSLRLASELAVVTKDRLHFLALFPTDGNGLGQGGIEVVENAQDAFVRYAIPVTPFGVVIGVDGRVTQASPLGSEPLLRQLVEDALQGR